MALPKDRVVLVTGASGGIGLATARAFLADGARVAAVARSEIRGLEGALRLRADVRRTEDVRRMVDETVARFGALHVLVNNAGVGLYASVADTAPESIEDVFRTNVFGPFEAVRAALPHLEKSKGQVINVSSSLARSSIPYMSAYCMSKYALHAFSQSLRVELRPQGVRVIEVGPGLTETGFQRNSKLFGVKRAMAPENRKGWPPEKVARAILKASRRGAREVWLTIDGRFFIRMQAAFPRFVDWGLDRWARGALGENSEFRSQNSGESPPPAPHGGNSGSPSQ
jgi:NAD(P)-dependent dehydrogenase (short-subunit alcohol dehydrogenase family)